MQAREADAGAVRGRDAAGDAGGEAGVVIRRRWGRGADAQGMRVSTR